MELQRDVQRGQSTEVEISRINPFDTPLSPEEKGIAAYSQENWEKLTIFTRFACWILGFVTEVEHKGEHFFVMKKSFQRVTKQKDLSDKAICDFFNEMSHGEIHAPKKKVGILNLSSIKKILSKNGVTPKQQKSIVQRVEEGKKVTDLTKINPEVIKAAEEVVKDELPVVKTKEIFQVVLPLIVEKEKALERLIEPASKRVAEPTFSKTLSQVEKPIVRSIFDEPLELEQLFVEERIPEVARPVVEPLVVVKSADFLALEHIRKLTSLFNKLGIAPTDELQKKFTKQLNALNRHLGEDFIKVPTTIAQSDSLAKAIIEGAKRFQVDYQLEKGKVQAQIRFGEEELIDRLRTIGPFGKYETHFNEIIREKNIPAAKQLLEALGDIEELEETAEVQELLRRVDFLQKIATKKAIVTAMMPAGKLPGAFQEPILQDVYSTAHEAEQVLKWLLQQFGDRARGAATLSEDHLNQQLHLHLINNEGQVVTVNFAIKQGLSGITHYEYGGQLFDSRDRLLGHFHGLWIDEQIRRSLEKMPVGSYTLSEMVLYVRENGGIKSYPYTQDVSAQARYTYQKTSYSKPQELIQKQFPGLAITSKVDLSGVTSELFDTKSTPGSYVRMKVSKKEYGAFVPQELLFVLGPTNEVMPLEYERRGNAYFLHGESYPTLDRLVKSHFSELENVQEAKTVNRERVKQLLKEQPAGTMLEIGLSGTDVNTMLFVVNAKGSVQDLSLWKEEKKVEAISVGNTPYGSIESFVDLMVRPAAVRPVPVTTRPLYSMRSFQTLLQTKQYLQEQFCTACDESEQMSLLLCFEGVQPQPFFLRPVKPQEKGDFTLVTGVIRSDKGTILPGFQDNIEILPDGKVRHVSNAKRGTYGRTFASLDDLAKNWKLGKFAYDQFARDESHCKTIEEATEAVQNVPMNSFLLWQSQEGQFHVTVKTEHDTVPKTYPLQRHNGFFVFNNEPVRHELITFLRGKFKLPTYGAARQAASELEPFLEEKKVTKRHFDSFKQHGNLFAMTHDDKEGLQLITYTPRSWGIAAVLNPIIEKKAVHLLPNGRVQVSGRDTPFESISAFKSYLATMHSIRLLELQKVRNEALIRSVVKELQQLGCAVPTSQNAKDLLGKAWAYLGQEATNRCLIVQKESGKDFALHYIAGNGELKEVALHAETDGLHLFGKKFKTLLQLLRKLELEPLNQITAQVNARKEALDIVDACPGVIVGGRAAVEAEFRPYLRSLLSTTYALSIDSDEQGVNQVYLSFVEGGRVKHELIGDELLKKLSDVQGAENQERVLLQNHKKMTVGKAFTKNREKFDEVQKKFAANCQAVRTNRNYFNISSQEAKKRLEAGSAEWIIYPEVPTKGWFGVLAPQEPDLQNCRLLGKSGEYTFHVDARTGQFRSGKSYFDSLDELVESLSK